jgi:hypothetical protein
MTDLLVAAYCLSPVTRFPTLIAIAAKAMMSPLVARHKITTFVAAAMTFVL